MLIVVRLVQPQLPFEIAMTPEPGPVQILAANGADKSLYERVRPRRIGSGLDLIDIQDAKVRPPAMKTKQRIVIRGEIFGQTLPRDRTIEHPAHSRCRRG